MDIIDPNEGTVLATGRDCFRFIFEEDFKKKYPLTSLGDNSQSSKKILNDHFDSIYKFYRNDLGHYFRYVYNIYKYIEENDSMYSFHNKLLRSQFSDYELLILYYNCICTRGEKLQRYAEKYSLFDNMPDDLLVNEGHLEIGRQLGVIGNSSGDKLED